MDYKISRISRNAARKLIAEIVRIHPRNIYFSRHALKEMDKDALTTVDIWNILKSPDSMILNEGEEEKESYRYRLETKFILVVIAFSEKGDGFTVITSWDKRK